VLASTDSSQNITTIDYGPYGESAAAPTGVAFRYTGRRFDAETGLYYYRARYYSPTLGRFLQTDPVGTKDDLNLYAYVGNDPLDRADPTGLCAEDLCVGEGGAAVLGAVAYYGSAALVAAGICVEACGAIHDWIGGTASGVWNHIVHNEAKGQQADEGKKAPPNPKGSRGSQEHPDKIKERIQELKGQGHTHEAGGSEKEETVRTPGGNKESRRPDITTTDPNGKPYRENVGRQNQDGSPVSRERKAQDDIRNATGQCAFTAYNSCK
jgi:RHS repeat-associated protein